MQAASGLFSFAPSLPRSSSKKSNILRVKSQYTPTAVPSASPGSMAAKWAQKTVVIPPQRRGCHLITPKVLKDIEQDLSGFKCGLAHFFLQHTSASLTINENYDSDVQADTETFLSRIVPEADVKVDIYPALILLNQIWPSDKADAETESNSSGSPDQFPKELGSFFLMWEYNYDHSYLKASTIAGRSAPWRHTIEGPDDMPAHIKSSMFGCALTIPITDGRLNMGTWQGIWLCEHRDHATPRKIVITLNGI